jgi:hypothetical protein
MRVMNVSVSEVLARTPPWVWVLFAYLAWIGILRLRPSVQPLGKIWFTPLIFVCWGLVGLVKRHADLAFVLPHWVMGAIIGGALGVLGGMTLTVDRPRQLVLLRGSVMPLVRITLIFGAHYLLQVGAALHPDARSSFLTWDIYVSGGSAGYFVGWAARFLQSYRRAPQADLAPVVALKGTPLR